MSATKESPNGSSHSSPPHTAEATDDDREIINGPDTQTTAPTTLAYPLADLSPFGVGSVNAVIAARDSRGVALAKYNLARALVDRTRSQPTAPVPLHRLHVTSLVERVGSEAAATSELTGPVACTEELASRITEFKRLIGGKPSAHAATIRDACRAAVTEEIDEVANAIDHVASRSPAALAPVLDQLDQTLAEAQISKPKIDGFRRLRRVGDFLTAAIFETLPSHKQPDTQAACLTDAQRGCVQAVSELAAALTAGEVRRQFQALRGRARQWRHRSDTLSSYHSKLLLALDDRVKRQAAQRESAANEQAISLPGPSTEEVMRAVRGHFGTSLEGVIDLLHERFPLTLAGKVGLDETADPIDVIRAATVEHGQTALDEILAPALEPFSLWQAINRYGPEELVRELVRRSACVVQLTRSSVENGIETPRRSTLQIERPPRGSDDEAVFTDFCQKLSVAVGRQGNDSLRVIPTERQHGRLLLTRTVMGFSHAVLADNHALAWSYVKSGELDHPCHLFGLLPDGSEGRASELLVEFFDCLKQECRDGQVE